MKHYYQPTNHSCVQSAAAIFLSYYDISKTPQDILKEVSVRSWPGSNEPAGTPNQDIAKYFAENGFDVEIISFDVWITDHSWIGKSTEHIKDRLKASSGTLTAPVIGREGSELYIQAYLDFIESGGRVSVRQALTTDYLKELLDCGPVMATVAFNTLHGIGKKKNTQDGIGEDYSTPDDISGAATNHNIVVEKLEGNKVTIYDPWKKPGVMDIDVDIMLAAVATAQQECDNMLIIAKKKD